VWNIYIYIYKVMVLGILVSGLVQDPTVGDYFKERQWEVKGEKFVKPIPPFEERW
jgi:hypothetical protein